jgi:integrase
MAIRRTTRETDLQHANKRLKEIEADIRGQRERTFKELADAYIADGAPARFVEPVVRKLGRIRARALRQDVVDEAAKKTYPKVSIETLNRQFYTPFIAIWNFAAHKEWVHSRTWARPRKPRSGTLVRRVIERSGTVPTTYDKAAQFVAAMSPAPAMLMTALFYTGMRPIELFTLEASSVNVATRWIVLEHTKTGEPRGVPMHEFLAPMLAALLKRNSLAEDPRLFRTPRGEPYPVHEGVGGQLKTAISGARRRSGVTDISPYTARHTVSTQLVINGVHSHIKDQILGHAVDDMSRHYTNVPQQPLIVAINTLPVPQVWRDLPWIADPLAWAGKLAEGTGRRTDLGR